MMHEVDETNMDLEMPSPEAPNHGGGSGAIRIIVQAQQVFLAGISPSVSRVDSSKSSIIDSSPDHQQHEKLQTPEAAEASDPLPASGSSDPLSASGSSDPLAASTEHHITIDQAVTHSPIENLSKIVLQRNLLALQEFEDLVGVEDALGTDLHKGISDEEALNRQKALSLCLAPTHTFLHFLWKEVKNKMYLLLFLAVTLSIVVEIIEEGMHDSWTHRVILIVYIVLLVLFSSILKYQRQKKDSMKLQKQQSEEGSVRGFQVIRGGETKDVGESELVYGDVLFLNAGYQVPADGLFVDGEDLQLHYGSASHMANKQKPFLSYGERVINGNARMVITCTDMMIRRATYDPNTRFQLETHLDKLNNDTRYILIIISIIIILVSFLRFLVGKTDNENSYRPESAVEPTGIRSFSNTFAKIIKESKNTKLLSVLVVGLNEGVPFVVSLALVYWNKKTLSAKVTVQDSHSILKMAAVTTICTNTLSELTDDDTEVQQLLSLQNMNKEATKAEMQACREFGIDIIIVSSKKLPVLKDIARQYGIITDNSPQSSMLTGEDFRNYTDKERLANVGKIRVLGEAFSSDKSLLVETLRENGSVVVILGQRADDAPALIRANIGIAMGRESSEKARESSDIIIWDGSFSEIIKMVDSGKCIYHNTQRFLQLVLITMISSTLISLIQTSAWGDDPFTILQSIWANSAVLFLGGFALLTKAPVDNPVSLVSITYGRSLITSKMIRNILLQVTYQVTFILIIQTEGSRITSSSQDMKNMVFNIFITCQFFNLLCASEPHNKNFFRCIYQHKHFWVALAVFMALHATFVTVQEFLGYGTRLKLKFWAVCVLGGVLSWVVDWLGKCISWLTIKKLVNRFRSTCMAFISF